MDEVLGITESERYLAKLCRRSFLSLWGYPNVYTDEGKRGAGGDGKELCDLLVIFGEDVIVFSDKKITFNEDVPLEVAWPRWFKKAVQRSANQIYGAENFIKRFPDRLFLDSKCRAPFPFTISPTRFHRVVVAHGIQDACRRHFGGVSIGSLLINTTVSGNDHWQLPFTVGHVDIVKGFVHVFGDFTLDAVFRELDTVADFIEYLRKREAFLSREKPAITAAGDEQLLSIYLTRLNTMGEHDFVLPEGGDEADLINFDESFLPAMASNPRYHAKKDADRVSYAWDRLIEHLIKNGQQLPGSPTSDEFESALRLMASEGRLRRRQLAAAFLDLLKNTQPNRSATRVCYSNDYPERAYVFLVLSNIDALPYEDYRDRRKVRLAAYCKVAKLVCPQANYILGFATEPPGSGGSSEDLVVMDVRNWTKEMNDEAIRLQRDARLLLPENVRRREGRDMEYPEVEVAHRSVEPRLNRHERRRLATLARKNRKR